MELAKQMVLEKTGFRHHSLDVTVGEKLRDGCTGLVVIGNVTKEAIYIEKENLWRLKK